ncbi:MAG: hypothetical protein K8T26_16745 [Lentisphaerae bacterium]|nr:hypothetical protein [Lentisphaerota bacterium]
MKILGVRCSNSDYTTCLLSGDAAAPKVEEMKHVNYPNGYGEAETLRWLRQEFQRLCNGQALDEVCIKRAETNVKRSNSLEARIQAEAIVALAAAESGCGKVQRKVGSTVAKDLGLKGKAKYLQTKLDTSAIPDFGDYSAKEQEAILVAWSCME